MKLTTMIFGADALPDGNALAQAAEVLRGHQQAGHALIAVIGALPGVYPLLYESTQLSNYSRVHNKLLSMHSSAARKLIYEAQDRGLLIQDVTDILETYNWMGRSMINRPPTPSEAATMLAVGERLSARLLAGHLQHKGIRAVHITDAIVTDENYLDATPDVAQTNERFTSKLVPLLEEGYIIIVSGALGITAHGKPTRLKGHGIYLSGSVLAASGGADSLWFLTNQDGILTADPELVPAAQTVPVLPASLLDDLAAHDIDVPTSGDVDLAINAQIPMFIRNMLNPTHPGTYIQPTSDTPPDTLPVIVTRTNIRALSLPGASLNPDDGIQALAEENIQALVGHEPPDKLLFLLRADQANIARLALSQAYPNSRIEASGDRSALVTLIGTEPEAPTYLSRHLDPPVQALTLDSHGPQPHTALLILEESVEAAVEKIHNLNLPQSK
ncbi:MAG: hypothetical protein CL610_01855 [Anaerolineaceae bacterium]|nr:hypothetical protein [Anaerolineaceae bacterium]